LLLGKVDPGLDGGLSGRCHGETRIEPMRKPMLSEDAVTLPPARQSAV
jgi:hypothetical protein